MAFKPLHDRILLKPVAAETRTKGGLIIPDTAQEKPMQGKVVAVGKGRRLEDGRLQPALPQVLAYAPLLLLGLWLGERLHRRFDERHFRIAIYILLVVTGTLLLSPWSLL